MIMEIEAHHLTNDDRFSGDNVIQFLLYIPVGLILLTIRLFLGILLWILSLILPEKALRPVKLALACGTFGVYVRKEGICDKKANLIVGNFVSELDPLAVHCAVGSLSLRKWKVPQFFASVIGVKGFSRFLGKQHFAENPDVSILVQPEGMPTNGRGLLLFNDWPFQIGNKVQPVAISVERPFTAVTVHSSQDSREEFPWSDVLWYLWTPLTTYKVKFLPVLTRDDNEADGAFIERIRSQIARSLQVELTNFTRNNVLMSISSAEAQRRRYPSSADRMRLAESVKQVLPDVPINDILRDLARTRSVDITIANFLEGVTPYIAENRQPEPIPTSSFRMPPPPIQASTSQARYVIQAPTGTFSKNAQERHLSFQEKKAQIIAEARRKYIEKHGLNVA